MRHQHGRRWLDCDTGTKHLHVLREPSIEIRGEERCHIIHKKLNVLHHVMQIHMNIFFYPEGVYAIKMPIYKANKKVHLPFTCIFGPRHFNCGVDMRRPSLAHKVYRSGAPPGFWSDYTIMSGSDSLRPKLNLVDCAQSNKASNSDGRLYPLS